MSHHKPPISGEVVHLKLPPQLYKRIYREAQLQRRNGHSLMVNMLGDEIMRLEIKRREEEQK